MIGQGLAGVIEQDNKRLEETALNSPIAVEERKVSFKRVVEDEEKGQAVKGAISKEDQETLDYFGSLRQAFSESELLQVLDIISSLSQDKDSIPTVVDLLGGEEDEEDQDTTMQNPVQAVNF